jgi:hypothetical protein
VESAKPIKSELALSLEGAEHLVQLIESISQGFIVPIQEAIELTFVLNCNWFFLYPKTFGLIGEEASLDFDAFLITIKEHLSQKN